MEKTTEDIQFTTEVPLPSLVKSTLLEQANKLLHRHLHRFGTAQLHLHVKRVGRQIGLAVGLFTDNGRYHAHTEDWDIRRAADYAFETIDAQILKQFDRRLSAHA